MGFISVGAVWLKKDDDLEDRSSRLAFELDGSMVLLNECSCERETEAGASFAAGHEREEDLLAQCLRNARPVVLDMQFQCQTIAVLAERHLADNPRAQRDLRAPGLDLLGERLGG